MVLPNEELTRDIILAVIIQDSLPLPYVEPRPGTIVKRNGRQLMAGTTRPTMVAELIRLGDPKYEHIWYHGNSSELLEYMQDNDSFFRIVDTSYLDFQLKNQIPITLEGKLPDISMSDEVELNALSHAGGDFEYYRFSQPILSADMAKALVLVEFNGIKSGGGEAVFLIRKADR